VQKEEWFKRLQEKLGLSLGVSPKALASKVPASNFSDLEQFSEDVQRRFVLSLPNANLKNIVTARLRQWATRYSVKDKKAN
jgi:hypothetical protein